MSFRSFLRDLLDDAPRYGAPIENRDLPQTPLPQITRGNPAWDEFFSGVPGLPAITEQTAMLISAVYACVNLIAGVISALPAIIYREQPDGEREQLFDDDLRWVLNEQFTPRWSAAVGWEYLVQSLLLPGDSMAIILRKGGLQSGAVAGIEPVHPNCVTVLATPDRMRLVYAVRRPDGALEVYDQDDFLHIPGFGFDGYRGLSPLRHHLRMSGAVSLATQEYSARFFANNARPDIVITTDQKLTPELAAEVADLWVAKHGGLGNAHRPAVLGNGAKAAPLSLNAEDAQLLATRQFQIEEIARIYGVPPFMIGHTDKTTSWGSGVETMGKGFVRFTLRQHLNKFQNELNRKFFRNSGKVIEFDTFDLESADMATLFTSYGVAIGGAGRPGFMSAAEIRNRIRLPRDPKYGELHSGEGTPPPEGQGAAPAKKKDAIVKKDQAA
jgi:HK97 family phage portal protein